jgi:DNA mismatch endonuclease, patch repair protein
MTKVVKPSAARSRQMALVKGRGNKSTETKIVSLLRRSKIWGWRRHARLPGRPDLAFRQQKVAVFLDGCFWHGCARCYRRPKSNVDFWTNKLAENVQRDRRVRARLRREGWTVIRIWEHEIRNERAVEIRIRKALLR